MPFAVVAADLMTRREVVFRRGRDRAGGRWRAWLDPGDLPRDAASGAYTLVDGGVLNPFPRVRWPRMGADVVIAVKLRPGPGRAAIDGLAAGRPAGRRRPSLCSSARSRSCRAGSRASR